MANTSIDGDLFHALCQCIQVSEMEMCDCVEIHEDDPDDKKNDCECICHLCLRAANGFDKGKRRNTRLDT
jgi:hypothetical protein